jgi:Putative small multi-drug export protein
MEDESTIQPNGHGAGALALFAALAIVLPLPVASVTRQSLPVTLALMGSTFLIEYGAAPVGIVGGLDPSFVLFVLVSIALGVTLLLFSICGSLEGHWPRFARFLERTRGRAEASTLLAKYGIYGLVPLVMVLGFYFCAPVACIFGWRRGQATLLIMAGYITACVATILATLGMIQVFFP